MRLMLLALVIAGMFLITAGCTQNSAPVVGSGNSSQPGGTTAGGSNPAAGGKVIGAYFFILDDAYAAAMSVKDEIPWKKINRVYIGFATVHDGVLTDYPAGSSPEDSAAREENRRKIRNVITLCRQENPDAEIFISSNFGGQDMDNEYLQAAQDPQKFADSVVSYMKKYGLDGYDMDWESRQIDDYAPQLTTLLSTCHATFAAAGDNPHGRPYLLTHTVWPGVESPETVAGLKDSVDQLNLMTYGPGDNYDLRTYADSYYQAGFPYERMVGGVESEAGYPEGGPDTQDSVAAKCAYVKEKNLAGLFEWRMDNDMRPDDGPPGFKVTGWMSGCMTAG
jgi:GH18 family chitinase